MQKSCLLVNLFTFIDIIICNNNKDDNNDNEFDSNNDNYYNDNELF